MNLLYLNQITKKIARDYLLLLETEKIKKSQNRFSVREPKTINDYLVNVKSFCKAMVKYDLMMKNPFDIVDCLPEEKPKPDYYSDDEIIKFFNQTMHTSYKDVFLTLLCTGMRIGELVNLKWKNIELDRELISIYKTNEFSPKTKNSIRKIPISFDVSQILKRLMDQPNHPDDYVFKSPKGCKLNPRRVLEKIKEVGVKSGIKSRLTVHKFRHTFATNIVLKGYSIYKVKSLLGHSSVQQTEVYASQESEKLKEEVNSVSYSQIILKKVD